MNNSFTTGPFQILRGVRQDDPLSANLFIICLEVLAISVRGNHEIQRIMVDKEEIKLEIFADELTAFLGNTRSLEVLILAADLFGQCSGLVTNSEKTECMFLGNSSPAAEVEFISSKNIRIENVIKILGIYFAYDVSLRKKLIFDEVVKSIKQKLQLWKWRDLTILGRIQTVKTFVIPVLLYRASLICLDGDELVEVNRFTVSIYLERKSRQG